MLALVPLRSARTASPKRENAETMTSRRWTLSICLLLLCAAWAAPSNAQGWPQRPVKFILPLGAGSGADIGARLLADRLTARWGKPVVVENRPGGDGFLAITSV